MSNRIVLLVIPLALVLAGGTIGMIVLERRGVFDTAGDAPNRVREGREARARGDYAGAVSAFDRAIRADPNYADAWLARANARRGVDDLPPAFADYNRAIELDPGLVEAYLGRSAVLLGLGGREAALADLNQAIAIAPEHPEALHRRAMLYRGEGMLERSLADYDALARVEPDNVSRLAERVDVLAALRRFEDVIEASERLLKRADDPRLETHLRDLDAQARLGLGDYEEAMAAFDALRGGAVGEAYIDRRIAWCLWGLGRYDESAALLDSAVERSPDSAHSQFARGVLDVIAARPEDALPRLRLAVEAGGRSDFMHLYLWFAERLAGQGDEADERLRRALIESGEAETHWRLATAQHLLGEVSEAELLDAASRPDRRFRTIEKQCEATFYIGAKRLAEGDEKGAREMFERCIATRVRDFYEYHTALAFLRSRRPDDLSRE